MHASPFVAALLLGCFAGGLHAATGRGFDPTFETTRADYTDSGKLITRGFTARPKLSADGRRVVFASFGAKLVSTGLVVEPDVYLYDRVLGVVSRSGGDDGTSTRGFAPGLSGDGQVVAFWASVVRLPSVYADQRWDVVVRDDEGRKTITTVDEQAAILPLGAPSLSTDGDLIAFSNYGKLDSELNLLADVFVYQRSTGILHRLARPPGEANQAPALSGDGTRLAFWRVLSRQPPRAQLLLVDRTTEITTPITDVELNFAIDPPSLSADGRFIAFGGVFVYDAVTAGTERVNIGVDGQQPDGVSFEPSISSDGRWVAFSSTARNLVRPTGRKDDHQVYLYDRATRRTTRVSVGPHGEEPTFYSTQPSISADGRVIAFASLGMVLLPGRSAGSDHIYFRATTCAPQERECLTGVRCVARRELRSVRCAGTPIPAALTRSWQRAGRLFEAVAGGGLGRARSERAIARATRLLSDAERLTAHSRLRPGACREDLFVRIAAAHASARALRRNSNHCTDLPF